jgi:hypothetical protein
LCLIIILSYYRPCFSIAGDTLSPSNSLSFSKGETILCQGSNFELGFFKPGTSSNIYLGIWFKKFDGRNGREIRKLPGAGGAILEAGAEDITLEIAWQITEPNMDINNATDFLLRAHKKKTEIFFSNICLYSLFF